MDEWIKTLAPLIGVLIGWLLSESGKIFSDKRQDKRKLKKLLYFLIELRFHFARELSYEINIDEVVGSIKRKMAEVTGIDEKHPDLDTAASVWKSLLESVFTKERQQDSKIDYLSSNIDKMLIELSEIFPFLAYELGGQHNIKERLNKANSYFDEVSNMAGEVPFDIKELVNPKLTQELLAELDISIKKVAGNISKKTLKQAKEKISKMKFDTNEIDKDKMAIELFEKLKASYNAANVTS